MVFLSSFIIINIMFSTQLLIINISEGFLYSFVCRINEKFHKYKNRDEKIVWHILIINYLRHHASSYYIRWKGKVGNMFWCRRGFLWVDSFWKLLWKRGLSFKHELTVFLLQAHALEFVLCSLIQVDSFVLRNIFLEQNLNEAY